MTDQPHDPELTPLQMLEFIGELISVPAYTNAERDTALEYIERLKALAWVQVTEPKRQPDEVIDGILERMQQWPPADDFHGEGVS